MPQEHRMCFTKCIVLLHVDYALMLVTLKKVLKDAKIRKYGYCGTLAWVGGSRRGVHKCLDTKMYVCIHVLHVAQTLYLMLTLLFWML